MLFFFAGGLKRMEGPISLVPSTTICSTCFLHHGLTILMTLFQIPTANSRKALQSPSERPINITGPGRKAPGLVSSVQALFVETTCANSDSF